jgi:putative flippase GtrA
MQFLLFSVIGTLGFFIDTGMLYFGLWILELPAYKARLFSYLIAASGAWILHRLYTFKTRKNAVFGEWIRFIIFNGFGGSVNYGISLLILKSPGFDTPIRD